MSNCNTCRFWGAEGETEEFRTCVRVLHDRAMPRLTDPLAEAERYMEGQGTFEDEREAYRQEKARTLAVVVDAEMYHAALRTSEAFGCVLHELPEEKGAAE